MKEMFPEVYPDAGKQVCLGAHILVITFLHEVMIKVSQRISQNEQIRRLFGFILKYSDHIV